MESEAQADLNCLPQVLVTTSLEVLRQNSAHVNCTVITVVAMCNGYDAILAGRNFIKIPEKFSASFFRVEG
jgi:hypothetical protein